MALCENLCIVIKKVTNDINLSSYDLFSLFSSFLFFFFFNKIFDEKTYSRLISNRNKN